MKYIFSILISIACLGLMAQDAHMSQFDASRVLLNPAETGMFKDADFKVGSQYRSQWSSLSTKYATTTISYDMPINDRWGVGGYFVNDDATKAYNVFKAVVGASYQIMKENDKHMLSVGLHAGIIYKNINLDKFVFDNQWQDDNFDPDKGSGEDFVNESKLMPEVNMGVYYESINAYQKLNPYAGLAFFHLTNPNESFLGTDNSKLPMRYQMNLGVKYKINDKWTLDPGGFGQYQGNIYEINAGLRAFYSLNDDFDIKAGGYYRVDDAAIILLGLKYKNVDFNITYDLNTSKLNNFTNGQGGLEFSLIFRGSLKGGLATLL